VTYLCAFAPLREASSEDATTPIDIGTRVELFVDDYLIEPGTVKNAALKLHPPERREVVLTTDKPWEGDASAYFTVFQDGSRYRMYYRGYTPADNSESQVTCYAESDDGIHFTRPNLSLHEFQSSKENNIVLSGTDSHNFAPFLDTNPAANPDERYKALAGITGKLFAYASPDGIHWKKIQPEPVMTKGAFDSLNLAFWDSTAKCYRAYSRYFEKSAEGGVRAIQGTQSSDFLNWSDPRPNRYAAGVPLEHFYTNATAPCPGAPHHLLSFPKRFVPQRTKVAAMKEPGVSDAMFMSSRDGENWDRTFREAWLRPGRDERNWTQRSNMPAWGIVQTGPDEFSMYVSEHYDWPDNRLRRVTIRRHGFASIHAGADGGEFVTRPIKFAGDRLVLNYATSAAGSIRVEVQDQDGKPMPGFALDDMPELYGDELDAVVQWKSGSDLSKLVGKPVRFRFVMRDADLFALQSSSNNEGVARPIPRVKIVANGESKTSPDQCRGIIVGPGVNQPDPFPGYDGFVGWESPIRLKNGDWLVGFNAGYWHASPPTPLQYSPKTLAEYRATGMPADIVAPTGGRAMITRSTDEGKTWSKPQRIVDTPADDRHPAFLELDDGTILCCFFTYSGEWKNGDPANGPPVRVFFTRSADGGKTWQEPWQLPSPFHYDETDGPFLRLKDGSIMLAVNARATSGPPDVAAFFRSTDGGQNWDLLSTIQAEHDLHEVTVAELPDGRLVMMARPEGDISWSGDQGRTWSAPQTFGMRMFAPSLSVLPDGTLVCLHGSYAPGHPGLRVIFSTDGGETWIAPAADHGFLVDNAYGYGKAMQLPDGSLFTAYIATGGHGTVDAANNAIRAIRFRIRDDHSGIDLLPAPNRNE
jgi:photosystem II stability/assembly factor-like uncharacterized protein